MTNGTNHFTIGIGSNSPDRQDQIDQAIIALSKAFQGFTHSDIYATPANDSSQPEYLNCVAVGFTSLSEDAMKEWLKGYERISGRQASKTGTVAIDLDLVIWCGRIIRPNDFAHTYFNTGYRQLLANGAFQVNF